MKMASYLEPNLVANSVNVNKLATANLWCRNLAILMPSLVSILQLLLPLLGATQDDDDLKMV